MSDTYKIYQYDYAAYFTGNVREISIYEGYEPYNWTTVEVPEIPEGYFAKFHKDTQTWEITENTRPELFIPASKVEKINTSLLPNDEPQTEPTVI